MTQLRVGDVKASVDRMSASLDPANGCTYASLTPRNSAIAAVSSTGSSKGW